MRVHMPMPSYNTGKVSQEAQARLTDAVRAAVAVMNKEGSSTDIMGIEAAKSLPPNMLSELHETDKLVKAMCRVAVTRQDKVNPLQLVRIGLFTHEWLKLKSDLTLLSFAQGLAQKDVQLFHQKALAHAKALHIATMTRSAEDKFLSDITLKNFAIAVGTIFIGIIGWKLWAARKVKDILRPEDTEENDDIHGQLESDVDVDRYISMMAKRDEHALGSHGDHDQETSLALT